MASDNTRAMGIDQAVALATYVMRVTFNTVLANWVESVSQSGDDDLIAAATAYANLSHGTGTTQDDTATAAMIFPDQTMQGMAVQNCWKNKNTIVRGSGSGTEVIGPGAGNTFWGQPQGKHGGFEV